jgi:hypothetical protein
MELRAVEELGEDRRDLLPDDARAVVGDGDAEAARLARRGRRASVADCLHLDDDVRENPGLFAGVERVVDGFLDTGQQGFTRIVESQEMSVLGEELGDGDLALASSHLDGGDPLLGGRRDRRLGRFGRGARLGTTRFTTTLCQWRSRWFAYTPHTSKI